MNKISEVDLARLAAFIDGEGTIGVYLSVEGKKRTLHYRLTLQVANTNQKLIDYFQSFFPGPNYKYTKKNSKDKPLYTWINTDEKARQALIELLPYFILKKEQAIVGIEFQERCHGRNKQFTGRKVPIWMANRREEYYQKMKELNKRGVERSEV